MTITTGPWAPYRPTAQNPWDLGKVAHLHRRAGFGGTWAELQRDLRDGPEASATRLLSPRAATTDEAQVLDSLRQGVLASNDSERLKAWWLYRVLYDPDPLREKLTLFWHSHFANSNRKVNSVALMLRQNELLRRHALGEFAPLLTDLVADPAMLIWLDGANSRRERPNENFAREFLELMTLGVGNYTEQDIREAARAFTGWVRTGGQRNFGQTAEFRFDAAQFDDGRKTFLGRTGNWNAADIVRITLEQPRCAEFLCRKLYRALVSEAAEPTDELIRPLAAELRQHRYEIRHVVGIMLRSTHFYERAARFARIKNPVEFSAGLVRALEVPRTDVRLLALAVACDRQGQELFYPPNVRGWVGGRTWLNSTTVLERGNWCNDVVWGNADLGIPRYDPVAWAARTGVPGRPAEALLELLLQDGPHADDRAAVLRAAEGGGADRLRRALQLAVHCPHYQLC
jgi:uncharacterized protein (DUF1800 family)